MATVHDVAAYILSKSSRMTAMKLQKLVYYSQSWHLAWTGEPLFEEKIQAWANGPVTYALFTQHRGKYWISQADLSRGNPAGLSADQVSSIDAVIDAYGGLSGAQLSALTHAETPWILARTGLGDGDHSSEEISPESMRSYYANLAGSGNSVETVDEINFPAWML